MCAAALLIGGLMFASPVYTTAMTASAATDTSDYVSEFRTESQSAADALSRANELNQKIEVPAGKAAPVLPEGRRHGGILHKLSHFLVALAFSVRRNVPAGLT